MNKKPIKLVLSGSGTLYPLHVGAINFLHDAGYEITHVTGVSGGAIVAGALASGYTGGKELTELILSTLPAPNRLVDLTWCPILRWGLVKGNKIEAKLRSLLKPTFNDTVIPLKVLAVNIEGNGNYRDPLFTVFDSSTPNQDIAAAIRASIAIPGVFTPKVIDGDRYIDGGVAANFPVTIYDEDDSHQVVGIHIRGKSDPTPPDSIGSYISSVIRIMMDSINREHIEQARWVKTLLIETDADGLNLRMTEDEAYTLIQEGYKQAENQFKNINLNENNSNKSQS